MENGAGSCADGGIDTLFGMPPKAKTVAVLAAPQGEEQDLDTGTDYTSFLAEIGADGSTAVMIYRKVTDPGMNVGKWAYCCRRMATSGILDDIQREYGGGTYNLKYADANTGHLKGQKTIVIQGSEITTAAKDAGGEDRLDRLERLLLEAIRGPAVDPLDNLAKVVGVVATLMPKAEPVGKDTSSKDLLDMYFRGRQEAAEEARAMAKITGVVSDSGDDIGKIAMPLVELIREQQVINRQQAASGGRPPQGAVAPSVNPVAEVQDMRPWWVHMLRSYIPDLYQRARAGKNARVYASAIVEDMPDAALSQVASLVSDPDFPAQFLVQFPMFNESVELQQWVGDFIAEVRDTITDDGDAEGAGEVASA